MASFVSTKLLRSTTSTQARSFLRSSPSLIRSSPYSTAPSPTDVQPSASTSSDDSAAPSQCSEIEAKHAELVVQLEGKNKTIAELKVRLFPSPNCTPHPHLFSLHLSISPVPLRTPDSELLPISKTFKKSRQEKKLKPKTLP